MKNLLYVSCHSILERDELRLFTDLGFDCFSYDGAYRYPQGNPDLPRPGIDGMRTHQELIDLCNGFPKTDMNPEVIEWADVIVIMHDPNVLVENWPKIKHKKVIWRSIGQSTKHVEKMLKPMRDEGLIVVRYSPMEEHIEGFIGANEVIRFYKDPKDFNNWNGNDKKIINFTQHLKGRRDFCHYDDIMKIIDGFDAKIYGPNNEDLGKLNGGNLGYDEMRKKMRDSRVAVYGGTWPACYTLSFMEYMMTGTPIVAIGAELAERLPGIPAADWFRFYEIPDIIKNGVNGFVSDNIDELRGYVKMLLEDDNLAYRISNNSRQDAVELFGKKNIMDKWSKLFASVL